MSWEHRSPRRSTASMTATFNVLGGPLAARSHWPSHRHNTYMGLCQYRCPSLAHAQTLVSVNHMALVWPSGNDCRPQLCKFCNSGPSNRLAGRIQETFHPGAICSHTELFYPLHGQLLWTSGCRHRLLDHSPVCRPLWQQDRRSIRQWTRNQYATRNDLT